MAKVFLRDDEVALQDGVAEEADDLNVEGLASVVGVLDGIAEFFLEDVGGDGGVDEGGDGGV